MSGRFIYRKRRSAAIISNNAFCTSLLQPPTTWSILSSAFLHSLHNVSFWLLSIFALTKFVFIIWFCAATIRLSVSLFKSPFWSQTQLCSLLTSLVCLKYWPCEAFSYQSYDLLLFFTFFKTFVSCKSCNLSSLAACISLSSLPWIYTSKPLTAISTQSSMAIKPLLHFF